MCVCYVLSHSVTQLFTASWTVACQAPLSMEFSRQGYWSKFLFPTPKDHPYPGIEPTTLMSPALAGRFFTTTHLGSSQYNSYQNLLQIHSQLILVNCRKILVIKLYALIFVVLLLLYIYIYIWYTS